METCNNFSDFAEACSRACIIDEHEQVVHLKWVSSFAEVNYGDAGGESTVFKLLVVL